MDIPKEFKNAESYDKVIETIEGAASKVWFCPECGSLCRYDEFPQNKLYGAKNIDCKCRSKEITKRKVKQYADISVFDSNIKNNTFANSKPINDKEKFFMNKFENFCNKFDDFQNKRVGIIMYGNPGTSKTYYTNCMINDLESKGKIYIAWNVSGYIRKIIDSYSKSSLDNALESKMLKSINDVDIVVLDDLGSEKLTEKGKEYLYNLVNEIYMKNKKLIVSTNNDFSSLDNHLRFNGSDKIMDRLREICYPFHFDWESRRGKNREELF